MPRGCRAAAQRDLSLEVPWLPLLMTPSLYTLLQASATRVQLGVPFKTRPPLARSVCPPGAPSARPPVSGSAADHPGTSAQGRLGSGQGAGGRVSLQRLLHRINEAFPAWSRARHTVLQALPAHGLAAHLTGKRHCLPGPQVAQPGHGPALLGRCPGIGSGSADFQSGCQRPRDQGNHEGLAHSLTQQTKE